MGRELVHLRDRSQHDRRAHERPRPPSANIEVWWSEAKNSEKFYHETCHLEEVGYKKTACYHLFVGTQTDTHASLYSEDEKFCCISSPRTIQRNAEQLTAPQSDWMAQMTYKGTKTRDFDFY